MRDNRSSDRLAFARLIAVEAGKVGISYFSDRNSLNIESKGHQDMVTQADRNVELFLRDEIAKAYPEDGVLGEEQGLSLIHI